MTKTIEFRGLNFEVYGEFVPGNTGDWVSPSEESIFEIDKVNLITELETVDFTEFLDNDMEEIEFLILNKYYE
jgi:hypothetical protein